MSKAPWGPCLPVGYSTTSWGCLDFLQSFLEKGYRVGPSLLHLAAPFTWHKLGRVEPPGWEDRASGSPNWGQHCQDSVGRMWPQLQSHTTQFLLASPTIAPLGGAHHQFSLCAATVLTAKASSAGWGYGTWETRSRQSSIGGGTGQAWGKWMSSTPLLSCVTMSAGVSKGSML